MGSTSTRRAALIACCRSLPAVTEDIKWGNDLMFSVGKKMFAGFSANGKDASFGCKVREDEFGVLTTMDGITPAPYAARYHWVSVDDGALPVAEATKLIRGSYELVKAGLSKKLQQQIDGGDSKKTPPKKTPPKKPKKPKKSGSAVSAARRRPRRS